ncbi:MAG: 30S ribosomal protein S21 [Desulfobacteria bacterium]
MRWERARKVPQPRTSQRFSGNRSFARIQIKERWHNLHSFEKRLKRLKRDFQRNVGPSIKRHRYYLSKGERSRLKHEKAIKRLNKKRRIRSYG